MTKGRRPKPRHLRLVTCTHRVDRHGDVQDVQAAVTNESAAFGPLEMPRYLKGAARAAWIRYIAPAKWLDGSRGVSAIVFCELWSELRRNPAAFPAAKHTQLRGYMSDLGLTDERKRPIEAHTEKDEFFDD
jgi:hypothetical protein